MIDSSQEKRARILLLLRKSLVFDPGIIPESLVEKSKKNFLVFLSIFSSASEEKTDQIILQKVFPEKHEIIRRKFEGLLGYDTSLTY